MVQPKYTKIKGYYGGHIIVIVCDIMGYNNSDFMAIYITINNCDLTNAHTHGGIRQWRYGGYTMGYISINYT